MSVPKPPKPSPTRSFLRREHTGWLVLFCFLSLALHFGVGVTSRSFDFGLPQTLPTPKPAEVEITLAPLSPNTLPKPIATNSPAVSPPVRQPLPRRPRREAPRPNRTIPPELVLPSLHETTETPHTIQTRADRSPKPLPLGLRSGRRDVPEIVETPRPEPLPSVIVTPPPTATPPPVRLQADISGARGGGGAGVPLDLPSVPNMEAPSRPALGNLANAPLTGGKNGGSGGGTNGGAGKSTGTGNGTGAGPYGITRGVPFGDRLGVPHGDPNGGGGGYKHPFRLTLQPENTDNTPPVHIVYVIDTSGSMIDGGKMNRAREALQKALTELRYDDTFNIVAFSSRARMVFPTMRRVSAASIAQANTNIELMSPDGETDLSDALDLALVQEDVSHVFVLSDGEPTKGIIEYADLLAHVRERNTKNVHIITLALGLGEKFRGISLLRALAEQNGGKFDYVNLRGR